MANVKGKHGGARPNSGPKPKQKTTSERVKRNWLAAARKIKKETGKTVEEHALRMVLDPDVQDTVKASIIKHYNEALIIKETIQDMTVTKKDGPAIGLPPIKEDPALKVVKGGKK